MLKTRLQIPTVQELRWKGVGEIKKNQIHSITAETQKKLVKENRFYGTKRN
jgi:hypothetical protein